MDPSKDKRPLPGGEAEKAVHGALERCRQHHAAEKDIPALAAAAATDPRSFILRAHKEAVDEALVAAHYRAPCLQDIIQCADPGPPQAPILALLKQEALERRWGARLLVLVTELERAGEWQAAEAIREEWQKTFAGISAANRVFEGIGGQALRYQTLKAQLDRAAGREAGRQSRIEKRERTQRYADRLMAGALKMTSDTDNAYRLVSRGLRLLAAQRHDINPWTPNSVRKHISIQQIRRTLAKELKRP